MNNSNLANIPDMLDDLLLQIIVDENNTNSEIQKSLEMNMNYILSIPVENSISTKFDNRYKAIIQLSKSKNLFWSKLLFLFMTFALISSFWQHPVPKSPNNSNAAIPVLNENTLDTLEEKEEINIKEPIKQFQKPTIKDTIPKIRKPNDSITNVTPSNPVVNIPHKPRARRINNDFFDEDFAISISIGSEKIPLYPAYYSINNYYTILTKHINLPRKKTHKDTVKIINKDFSMIPFYEGVPFKKNFENYTFISIAPKLDEASKSVKESILRYRLPTALNLYLNTMDSSLKTYSIFQEDENLKYLKPFYISNYEVSNLDYQEFVYWVARYNGIEHLYLNNKDSMEYYSKFLNYSFHTENKEYKKRFGTNSINVQPKINSWTTDFPNAFCDPMDEYYFTHPAYKNYPVVGVSYWQALAYLDWLTWIWQSRLDAQNIPYDIEYDLPTAYEWEQACKEELSKLAIMFYNDYIVCNLAVKMVDDMEYRRALGLFNNKDAAESFFTSPVQSAGITLPQIKTGILNLDGNVSEWLKEDYQENWINHYKRMLDYYSNNKTTGTEILIASLQYFDQTCNSQDGKLVSGANWFDSRFADRSHSLSMGMKAKAFINPDDQHSTLGFRPVIRVRLKNETQLLTKARTLGRILPEIDYNLMKLENNEVPNGFKFIPMGTINSKSKIISIQAFYAMQTEVTNLTWMLFLNDLIEKAEWDKLKDCIPSDSEWVYKMNYESDKYADFKIKNRMDFLPFSKDFLKKNNIEDIPWTIFAFEPVVGISHKAAELFSQWMTDRTGVSNSMRLPMEAEYEKMAYGGISDTNNYPWVGKFTRNYQGIFLAKYLTISPSASDDFDNPVYQNQKITTGRNDQNWTKYQGPMPVSTLLPNDYGLYEISGNAAEMVREKGITKGGSWASPAKYLQVKEKEAWSNLPSDCVGFRLVFTYLTKE